MAYNTAGGKTYNLGSSIGSTDTSILLSSFLEPVSGTPYTMVLLNTDIVYGTIAPGTTSSEFISFTGITQNANGSALLTGVTRGLQKKYPYTTSATFKLPHSGQSIFILSDAPQVFNEYDAIKNNITLIGKKTFPGGGNANAPVSGTVYAAPTDNLEYASKKYVDDVAIAGAPDATLTIKGIVEIATTAEIDAGTSIGGTGASVVARPDQLAASIYGTRLPTAGQKAALPGNNTDIAVGAGNFYVTQTGLQKQAECYAASATGNDTYVITLSPVPISLVNGMTLRFKADVANTGAATLNVNSLGPLAIVTAVGTALATGDIVANQVCEVIYNSTGTVWQLINPASVVLSNPTASILASVPNTDTTPDVWYTWTIPPIIERALTGPTYTPDGWTFNGTMANPGDEVGGGGNTRIPSASAGEWFALIPGNGSNLSYTAASNKDIKFKTRFKYAASLGVATYGGFGFEDAITTANNVETDNAISVRFVCNNATMFAVTATGAANTNTNISAFLTLTDWNIFEIIFNPGTNAKFYINGVLAATHTTNLPTGSLSGFGYGTTAGALGNGSPIVFGLEL